MRPFSVHFTVYWGLFSCIFSFSLRFSMHLRMIKGLWNMWLCEYEFKSIAELKNLLWITGFWSKPAPNLLRTCSKLIPSLVQTCSELGPNLLQACSRSAPGLLDAYLVRKSFMHKMNCNVVISVLVVLITCVSVALAGGQNQYYYYPAQQQQQQPYYGSKGQQYQQYYQPSYQYQYYPQPPVYYQPQQPYYGSKGQTNSGSNWNYGCSDSHQSCPHWAQKNECNVNPRWMRDNCRLSCNCCNSWGKKK